jgi:hypothetical protein
VDCTSSEGPERGGSIARIVLLANLAAGAIPAQLATSSLVGTVTDPSGLGVPGVSVKAVHVANDPRQIQLGLRLVF